MGSTIWVATKRPSGKYTYGLRKATILASMLNGILILVAAVHLAWEAIQKFQDPVEVPGNIVMIVASIGLLISEPQFSFIKTRKVISISKEPFYTWQPMQLLRLEFYWED